MYIDCHAHLSFYGKEEPTIQDYERRVNNAKQTNVSYIVDVLLYPDIFPYIEYQHQFHEVLSVFGISRGAAKKNYRPLINELRTFLENNPKPTALGEIGLDYYHAKHQKLRIRQQNLFKQQIRIARQFNLPIVIHSRDADADLLKILRGEQAYDVPIQIHFCTCDKKTRKELLDNGCYLSFGGPHTWSTTLQDIVKETPLDRILTETDAPALPVPGKKRGNSEPADVSKVTVRLAQLKNVELEQFAAAVMYNAKQFFKF